MNHLNRLNEPNEPVSQSSSQDAFAELELQWQDAHAQRQRAEELFHSDELGYSADDELDD